MTTNRLAGKRIVEFACGEGGAAAILCRLGCRYLGVDIAPSAVEKARHTLAPFPDADVRALDMVAERPDGRFDAALDRMGIHMLVTDADRSRYLANAASLLRPGAPMLFHNICHREDAHEGAVESIEEWMRIRDMPYHQPRMVSIPVDGREVEVDIPILPARSVSEAHYRRELAAAGFTVELFQPLAPGWATIHARRGG